MSRWWSTTVVVGVLCLGLVGLAVGPTAVAAQGPAPVVVTDLNGTGTATDPYVVTNASELQAMNQSLGANYTLGGDVDASETAGWFGGSGFVPVGNATAPFGGSLDGSGYGIENLTVSISPGSSGADGRDAALFNRTEGASFSALRLVNVSVTGGDGGSSMSTDGGNGGGAGGLIAVLNNGSVTDVVLTDSIITSGSGADGYGGGGNGGPAGGLVASTANGTITNVTVVNSTVSAGDGGTDTTTGTFPGAGGRSGGVVGTLTDGTVTGSAVRNSDIDSGDGATGSEGDGDSGYSGGIAAATTDGVVNSSSVDAETNVTGGTGGTYAAAGVGGLVGYTDGGTVSQSRTAATVTGVSRNVGGVVGYNDGGTVSSTYAQGTVDGTTSVGGLVGEHRFSATIDNSSAHAAVNGTTGVGGLVGTSNAARVTDSFATGAVNGTTTVGGLVGSLDSDSQLYGSHWNTETTGQTNSTGVQTGVRVGLSGLSTSQMTGSSVKSYMSLFDYTSVWTVTDSYPQHQWAVENVTLTVAEPTITDEGSTSATVTLSLVDGSTVSATTTAVVTTTDSEVLSTDGSVVTAVGTGTAQVSTTVGGLTDSATVTVEATEEEEASNDTDGGGSSGSSGGSRSNDGDSSTTVTAVDATDETVSDATDTDGTTDEGDETGDESTATSNRGDTVRVSSASASVRGGSTLEITLPSTDDGDEPTDGEESTDEDEPVDEAADGETDQPIDDETDDTTDGEAGGGEEADADPNQPPPPPVSVAEIERVEIDVSEDVDAEVEIRQSRSPPSDDASEFQRDDGTQAAGYIQVTDNLDDDQVTEGRITFRVSKADLETDAADPENVALYHYVPETDEWAELDTEILGETDGYVRFRGTTPGFSQFAAGIKRAQFEISDAILDVQQVSLDDSIQVEAIVTNTGGADGTFTTQLLVDSEVVAEDVLTIASGGQRATIFDHQFSVADTYQVRVNDVITGEIQVTDPNAAAESTDDSLPGFGFGTALLTLVVSTLLYRRRAV